MHGYHGRYLRYDLDAEAGEALTLPEAEARAFIGGVGLATRWLYRHQPAGADPLSPANPLVVASCPLVDTGVTTTAKCAFAARSPLTGLLGESLLSSHFAVALKRSGWDGVVLAGACPVLSAFVLDGEKFRVIPVPELAGVPASEAEAALRARLGSGFQVAAIGLAGERGVRYATITHDGRHAGRTGLGAVMGAKRLKAIAVRGSRRLAANDPDGLRQAARRLQRRSLGPETAKYRLAGTSANLLTFDRLGVLPSRNFQGSQFGEAERLTGERLATDHVRERSGCVACTVGCEHRFVPAGGAASVRAEYESLFALGPLLGLGDPDAVLEAVRLCDLYGMDTLSLGGTLAWAMECAERGVGLPGVDANGRMGEGGNGGGGVGFGEAGAVLALIPRIAGREGELGDLLAEGSRAAAVRVGRGSEAWAMHVKGLELPGYEPRALKTLALGLAVGARGACHNRSSAYDADFSAGTERLRSGVPRGAAAAASEDRAAVLDALVVCKFLRRCFDDFYAEAADLLARVTGWYLGAEELAQVGARIVTLKRLYNQREGAGRAEDTLPPRLLSEPVADGPGAGTALTRAELDAMLDEYYAARGWNRDGTVPEAAAREVLR